jgi:glycolate dehydrogenase FAD-binding subunit
MSPAEAAEAMGSCGAVGLRIRMRGAGTKSGWGRPVPEPDVEMDTSGLHRVVEHNAGDLTAVLQAGMPLAQAQAVFAAEGQMLAIDPPIAEVRGDPATVGGVVSTADSGPLRHRYGAIRDLVVGITVALSDGTLAHSGGRVIKNVAGYDLAKLFSGSFGTLGLVVEVAVRLHPRPPASLTVAAHGSDPAVLSRAAAAVSHASLEADCLDVSWQEGRGAVLVRFSGGHPKARATQARDLLARAGLEADPFIEDDEDIWMRQRAGQRTGAGVVVRVSGLQTALGQVLQAAQVLSSSVVGRAGLGLSWIRVPDAPAADLVATVEELRKRLQPFPCVVLDAPEEVRGKLDPWGEEAGELMRRVKERFDPAGVCNPGLFVGGI